MVFNLSADDESIGKHKYLCSLIAQQSARCICGYVFSSSGFGESTQDLVFAGNGLIYENGKQLARSDRFSFEEQIIVSEIDVERIRAERRINTTFAENARKDCTNVTIIECPTDIPEDFQLTRYVSPHPFVPAGSEISR